MMRRFLPLSLVVAPLLSSCGPARQEAGVIHLAQTPDPTTLDPARAYDTTSIQFVRVLYRGLVDYDYNARIQPEVAQTYSVSPDGLTYRFHLRPDVRWWNKTPVTASDFRCAIERALDPDTASDGSSFFTGIHGASEWIKSRKTARPLPHVAGILVSSPRDIAFRLDKPDATFLSRLTLPFAYAVPEATIQKLKASGASGDEVSQRLSDQPMGNGPFKFVSWVHDSELRLERNPDYFRPGLPKAKALVARFGISPTLQTMLFEQGAIDVLPISDANPPDFLRLSNAPKWKPYLESAPMMDVRYLTMNNELAPFKDRRVRQAFCYAINRDRILAVLTGRATKARGALPEGVPSYDPRLFSYPYDPAKARALLRAAHFAADPIPLLYPTNEDWYAKAAQSIQQDLGAVGVRIELKPMRYGDLKAKAGTRGSAGAMMGLMGWLQDFPDPSNYLDTLFNTRSITPTASLNRSFYSNPKVDKLLDDALAMPNGPARWAKYRQAQRLIVDDAPVVFLHNTRRTIIRQPRVSGFRLHPAWSANYEDLGVG